MQVVVQWDVGGAEWTHVDERVIINLEEPAEQLRFPGLTVGQEDGDQSLAVRPPELHAPLQLLANKCFC